MSFNVTVLSPTVQLHAFPLLGRYVILLLSCNIIVNRKENLLQGLELGSCKYHSSNTKTSIFGCES